MAKQGTYAAYQRLQPITDFDPTKALMEVEDFELRKDANRRANEQFEHLKKKYDDQRKDLFAKALSGDLNALGDLAVRTGQMGLDEAIYSHVTDVKDRIFELSEKYGEELYSNPKALAEMSTLMNSAKYLSKATEYAGTIMNEISVGIKPQLDKNGKLIAPIYSSYNQKYIDIVQGIVNGKYQIQYVNGRPVAAVNDGNSVQMVDIISLAQQQFSRLIKYVDTDAYLKEIDDRLGADAYIMSQNGRIIEDKSFNRIKDNVREMVVADFGEYGNLTDLGVSYLADRVGMSPYAIDGLSEEDYNRAIDTLMREIELNFESSYSEKFDTAYLNHIESKRHNQVTESLAKKKEERLSENGVKYSTSVFNSKAGTTNISYSIPKGKNVYIDEEGNTIFGDSTTTVKGRKFNNLIVTEDGRFVLTDGKESIYINSSGVPTIANELGFSTVDELVNDAQNRIREYKNEPSTSNSNSSNFDINSYLKEMGLN